MKKIDYYLPFYIGSTIIRIDKLTNYVFKMVEIVTHEFLSELNNNGSIYDYKLILKSLDQIDDDEACEVYKLIYGDDQNANEKSILGKHIRKRLIEYSMNINETTRVINYLRSISVDCDDLLNNELAINK